jgi:D-alanyl-D-alanine dipeptidase
MTRQTLSIALLALLMMSCASTMQHEWLGDSTQLLVVTTADWDTTKGTLTMYERRNGAWIATGDAIPVVVGRTGLAWGSGLPLPLRREGPIKKEGDGKAPAGLFALPSLFGYADEPISTRMPYIAATPTVECVDDATSPHYNEIVDTRQVPKTWNSSEDMRRHDELYREGVVVAHNANPAVAGNGSCIFLHLWSGPESSTAGCTAMSEANLSKLTRWLDTKQHPKLLQLTRRDLAKIKL